MSRPKRDFQLGYCYHVTTRCNNREFKLTRHECRQVFLYALKNALNKFDFKLFYGSIPNIKYCSAGILPTSYIKGARCSHYVIFLNWDASTEKGYSWGNQFLPCQGGYKYSKSEWHPR